MLRGQDALEDITLQPVSRLALDLMVPLRSIDLFRLQLFVDGTGGSTKHGSSTVPAWGLCVIGFTLMVRVAFWESLVLLCPA